MRCAPRLVAVVGAAGLAIGLLSGSVPAGAVSSRTDVAAARPPQPHSVTLLTGDRVLLGAPGRSASGEVVPGPGRRAMTFRTYRVGGRLHVVPADALALITAGRLDPRLFDVTGLLAAEQDGGARLPLAVAYSGSRGAGPHTRRTRERPDSRWWSEVRPRDPSVPAFRGGVSQVRLDDSGSVRTPHEPQRASGSGARTRSKQSADGTQTYELTITHLDRSGRRTDGFGDLVFGLDADVLEFPTSAGATGTTRLRLPKGRYHLESSVTSGDEADPDFHTVVRPLLTLDRDTTLTVDARATKPVSVAAPRPSARLALVDLAYRRHASSGRTLESGILSRRLDDTFTAHQGPAVDPDELVDRVHVQWAEPDGRGGFTNSPYVYGYFWQVRGHYLTGFRGTVPERDLASVRSRHVAQPGGHRALRFFAPRSADGFGGWSVGIPYSMPSRLTAHLMAGGVRWSGALIHVDQSGAEGDEETWLSSGWRAYTAGRAYDERWNAAVLSPALAGSTEYPPLARYGDRIVVRLPMYVDQAGHLGGSQTDGGHTTLYRDGAVVGQSGETGNGEFRVPPGRARYRLETSATRTVAGLSTDIRTAWTFDSQRTSPVGRRLPVSVARFALPVDDRNRVPAGVTSLPLTVESQVDGARGAGVRKLTVSLSRDDGHTWRPVRVVRQGGSRWVVVAWIPPGPGYLSLRTRVVDLRGNSSEQTVLRASAVR